MIQNTQNRAARAIHLKLDELIRVMKGDRNTLVDLENVSDEQLEKLQEEFTRFRKQQSLLVRNTGEVSEETVDGLTFRSF